MNRAERRRAARIRTAPAGYVIMDRSDLKDFMGTCQLCGAENEELRPYGPGGKSICFKCGMKDEPATAAVFKSLIDS